MSDSTVQRSGRRDFLQNVIGAGVAVAGVGLLTGCAGATSTASAAPAPASKFDMSWTSKLKRYKTAYDSPEIYNGAALSLAAAAAAGYKAAMNVGSDEFTPVLILRHTASVMTLNDDMWARLNFGETYKLKDPTTGEANTKRNPFLTYTKGDKNSYTGAEAALATMIENGAVALCCNYALTGVARMLMKKEPAFTTVDAALAEVHKSVIPGAYVMPNGIFAVSAAQDNGCHYMRVLV